MTIRRHCDQAKAKCGNLVIVKHQNLYKDFNTFYIIPQQKKIVKNSLNDFFLFHLFFSFSSNFLKSGTPKKSNA